MLESWDYSLIRYLFGEKNFSQNLPNIAFLKKSATDQTKISEMMKSYDLNQVLSFAEVPNLGSRLCWTTSFKKESSAKESINQVRTVEKRKIFKSLFFRIETLKIQKP